MITFKNIFKIILTGFFVITLIACEGRGLKNRETGALAGGALGAGLGAIVGNQVGSSGAGIAIGSAIGAVSGALVGNSIDAQEERADDIDRRIADQDRELAENRRILDSLRANGLDVRTTDRGVVVNLPDVLFQFNSARVTSNAKHAIRDISRVVDSVRNRRISIEGHADSVGTNGYNEQLSLDRARSVADELIANGTSPRRISTRGYGESRPIASNSTASGRAKNRRVEVVIEN